MFLTHDLMLHRRQESSFRHVARLLITVILSVMLVVGLLALDFASFSVHQECNNQAVKTQDFSEDENQDHSDEETWLLCCSADAGVTDNTNRKSRAGSELDL